MRRPVGVDAAGVRRWTPTWLVDPAEYPVVDRLPPDGAPTLRHLRRDAFPRWLVASRWNAVFLNDDALSTGWRCFVTGVQCHALSKALYPLGVDRFPWALSVDHLVPLAARDEGRGVERVSNRAVAGRWVNRKVGHVPLPLKLLHRQVFRGMGFGDRPADASTLAEVRSVVIDTEEGLRSGGLFPRKTWSYPPGPAAARAWAFHREMVAYHDEFLSVPAGERAAFLDAFAWRW